MNTRILARRRMLVEGLLISAVGWLVLIVCAVVFDANQPQRTAASTLHPWLRFAILVLVVQTIWIKAWLMYRRTLPGRHTRLGTSLICFNIGFFILYVWSTIVALWPSLRSTHAWVSDVIVTGWVAVWCLWAAIELTISEDPNTPGNEPYDPAIHGERRVGPPDRRAKAT